MTVSDPIARDRLPETVVYYDDDFPAAPAELRRGIEDASSLSLAAFESLSGRGESAGSDEAHLTLVFTERVPADAAALTAGRAIWVTTEAAVVTAGLDAGATDVFHWSPADGWDVLAAKLGHRLDGVGGPSATDDHAVPDRALQRISDGVLALDDRFRITYLNDAMAALLRDADGDVLGDRLWDRLPPAVTEDLRPALERAMDAGETVTTEFQAPATAQWFEVTAYPSAAGLSLYGREITERKQREIQQARYEHLVETVGDAVYLLDAEGRFTYVNDALCAMTGYDRDDLLGSSVHIIKDDGTVAEAEDALRDLLREQADSDGMPIAKLDVELVTADDGTVPATDRMTLRPLSEDGEFTGTVGTLRDVSRQRRRHDVLSGILAATQDMMAATTTDEVARQVVDTVVDVFGFDLVAVHEHDAETDRLVPVATSDGGDETSTERPAYALEEGPVGTAYTEDRLVVQEARSGLDDWDRGGVEVGGYCPIGDTRTLSFGTRDEAGFTDDDERLIELLAETAAAAFEGVTREEERRRYEAVIEAAEDKLFTLDDDGRITLATEQFAESVGADREALAGREIGEFLADTEAAAAVADLETAADVETDLRTRDGEAVPSRIRTARFSSPYGDGVVGTVRDLSALRSAQQAASRNRQRFTELFETLSDPVADVEYGPDGAVVSRANAAFAALCDERDRSLVDRPLAAVRQALPESIAAALDPVTSPGASVETAVSTQTGAERKRFVLKTVPYESTDGQRAFVVLTDVTDLAQRETHLQVLHRLLRHNLRNETTVIQGYAEAIVQRETNAEIGDFARQIFEASSSLVEAADTARTIQRVLEMDAEDVESVPVERAAEQIDADVLADYPEADATLANEATGTVSFSHHLLVGIAELVDNAVEHSSTSSRTGSDDAIEHVGGDAPSVAVELADAPDSNAVCLRVSDDGPGMPESEWEVVAGEQEITQLQHTQGLGLWLVRWVVDKHSGDLALERSGEDGTTVAIRLPR
ncbi:PAS domain-containing protein [Halorientalis halophila]|uniref:PAS domain-containing protein n=1 Tax=Halorientalis halophila TaxID=3108499 RepID=UPI003009D93D